MILLDRSETRIPVAFTNKDGLRLTATVYLPQEIRRDRAIVIPVNSIKYRIGSFRYHHLLAMKLTEFGFLVLCFDPAGIGDSEGDLGRRQVESVFIDIQNGAHVRDAHCAIDWLESTYGVSKVVMIGLCGGAVTSVIAASRDRRIDNVALLGIPVLFDRDPNQPASSSNDKPGGDTVASERTARHILQRKLVRVSDLHVWKTLLTGGFNLRVEAREVFDSLRRLAVNRVKAIGRKRKRHDLMDMSFVPLSEHPRYNMNVQKSLVEIWLRNKRPLLIAGSLDPVTGIFEDEFLRPLLALFPNASENFEYFVIERGNHIFSSAESQEILTRKIIEWLDPIEFRASAAGTRTHFKTPNRSEDKRERA